MRNLRLQYFDSATGTPALEALVLGWAGLFRERRVTSRTWAVSWDDQAFVAFLGDRPIGAIGFTHQKSTREIVVKMGWVEGRYRRRGVYSALWALLVKHAQANEIPHISSGTMLDNKPMRGFAKAHGRKETRVDICFDVPARGEPVCVHCGCTESNACQTSEGTCAWVPGSDKTVCTAPACVRKAAKLQGGVGRHAR